MKPSYLLFVSFLLAMLLMAALKTFAMGEEEISNINKTQRAVEIFECTISGKAPGAQMTKAAKEFALRRGFEIYKSNPGNTLDEVTVELQLGNLEIIALNPFEINVFLVSFYAKKPTPQTDARLLSQDFIKFISRPDLVCKKAAR